MALSLGGNHLNIRAEPGAKMHPAAKPLVNLNTMALEKDVAKPVNMHKMPARTKERVKMRFAPTLSETYPIGSCMAK